MQLELKPVVTYVLGDALLLFSRVYLVIKKRLNVSSWLHARRIQNVRIERV
jgi:hypothetical protein